MFKNFDPQLFADANFKEDSVREVVILPVLSRLGYHPTGNQSIVRSKSLVQPFIFVGTRKHSVTTIPDYTLYFDGRAVLVLDAKAPSESVTAPDNVQQAYSYAIHPEVRAKHFALCNGRRLAVFNVESATPLLNLAFEEFESSWSQIEKHMAPKYLMEPALRDFAPDFGLKISRLGLTHESQVLMLGVRLNTFMKFDDSLYTVTVNVEFAGEDHCVSFDFTPEKLPLLVGGLPIELQKQFLGALARAPFHACAELVIEADFQAHLGEEVKTEDETFVPLIIDEVIASRFNPSEIPNRPTDIPSYVFRLRDSFRVGEGREANDV